MQILEYEEPGASAGEGVCVITNYELLPAVATGPVTADVLDLQLNTNQQIELDLLDTTQPRVRLRQLSFQLSPPSPSYTSLGVWPVGSLFSRSGLITSKLTPTGTFTALDVIRLTPVKRVYQLVVKAFSDPDTMSTSYGWDIDELRTVVNADNPWIEMLERGATEGPGGPVPNPFPPDVQDEQADALFLTPFAEQRLIGGDGIPDNPDREITGPSRSIVHVNYGEAQNGALSEINVVYEWNGLNSRVGAWKAY